jgi:hypothetical protein
MILDLSGGKCEVRGDCGGAYPATAPKLMVTKLGRFKTAVGKTAFVWSFPYVCPEPVLAK